MRRALPWLLVFASACSLRAPRTDVQTCTSSRQCDPGDVCFLGACRGRSQSLSLVVAEVRPPNDGQLGELQQGHIDLSQTVIHDFALQPPLAVSGHVAQEQDLAGGTAPVAGAALVFTDHAPAIPDRVNKVPARTDVAGNYAARLPSGSWDLLVTPPAPLPPLRAAGVSAATNAANVTLPKVSSLTRVQGTASASGTPIEGAVITAVNASGQPISAPGASADGGFTLLLPPATPSYYLQLSPPGELDGGVAAEPLPTWDGLGPYDNTAPAVSLTLPPTATLSGRVVDAAGAAVPQANVYARSDGMPWTLSRSTTTASDGTYALLLRAGKYLVEAAPGGGADLPALSGEVSVTLPAQGIGVDLPCPRKIRVVGQVLLPDGRPAGANVQANATRLADKLITTRTATSVATDSGGNYHLVGDPGTWRLELVPPPDAALPRKLVQIVLGGTGLTETALPAIQLSNPLEAVGTVHGAPPGGLDAPVAGATVDFFALDPGGALTVYLGSGVTDAQGRYKVILPDVPQPASAGP